MRAAAGQQGLLRVLDYILVSQRVRSSILDCRTYRGFDRGSSDHYLLVVSLKLRLSRQQQQPASATAVVHYATERLQQVEVAQQYSISLANRFSQLPTTSSDVEAEWTAMKTATQATAQSILGTQQRQTQHKPGLTENTMSGINRKQQAFKTWELLRHKQHHIQQQEAAAQHDGSSLQQQQRLQRSAAAATAATDRAKRNYNILSRAAERRVESDLQRHLTAQAVQAEQLWKEGRMSAFHKLVQRMFKGKPAAVGSTGILSKDGRTTYRSVQEQLKRFVEHFVEVLDAGSITAEQAAHMEEEISSVEEVLRQRAREQQSSQQHRNDMQQPSGRSAEPRSDAAAHL